MTHAPIDVRAVLAGPFAPGQSVPKAFLDLPGQIYRDDPHWLGEDPDSVCAQFSQQNPWFKNGQAWLGVVPEQARLAGFTCPRQVDGETVCFFGFWEGINELAPHQWLFEALQTWARKQGATRLYGPINFSTFSSYRLRLDAFEQGAFPGEPWNPDYYPDLLTQLGFNCRYRYLSTFNQTTDVVGTVEADYLRVKPKLEQAVRMEAMTPAFWMSHLDELYGFVDEVFGANFAYTPISREAFHAYCGTAFASRFCPHSSVLARSLDGRIAGFFLLFPDYAPLLRQQQSTPVAAADLRYDRHAALLPRPRRGLAKTGGVHPDFRSLGLFTAMSCELSLRAEGRYQELAAALVREDNNSRQFALRHGTAAQRHYGLFQRGL
ncbi:MAG: hypothetical protein LAT63_15305 [Marinobacter sp.]|nr:hypothetical protein [Marinobacter sp.]